MADERVEVVVRALDRVRHEQSLGACAEAVLAALDAHSAPGELQARIAEIINRDVDELWLPDECPIEQQRGLTESVARKIAAGLVVSQGEPE